jgi:TolB-like protein/Tfp pilus assembly protein PilF
MTTHRRLAAILVADVVGYSRLMEADETGTLAALKQRREAILGPMVRAHGGRVVKFMGDGVLVEFASAVKAVEAALELQRRMAEANEPLPEDRRIVLRIGINLGDVIGDGSDIYGDGVNIAARLEALAQPGGICISAKVHEETRGKIDVTFEHAGEQQLKNIVAPVKIYRHSPGAQQGKASALPIPNKASIAVLPFTSMSNDPEQETFADGLTEDLITDLSRNAGLFVIARNSSFAYKGKSVDVRQIAHGLGVRYLLEGSARRAAGRVRINVQLIDAAGSGHVWAERFDRNLEDIFAVQDEVTAKIVEALIGRLTALPVRNRPKSMEAYDLCVRARILTEHSPQAAREAHLLLQEAIRIDPDYAEAHRWLALNRFMAWAHWGEPIDANRSMAVATAERAVALDPNDAGCRWIFAMVLAYEGRWQESDAEYATAFALDPNHADAWAHLSDISFLRGRAAEGLEQIEKAFRLNPYLASWYFWLLGQAQYAARQYGAAVSTLRKEDTYRTGSRRILAASLAQLGRLEEARRETEMFLLSNPHFTISHWASTQPFQDAAMREHFIDGYRKAGLPE